VLSPLRLLEAEREVSVVLGAAEIGQLSEAEPEDPVDQGVGEVEIRAVGDRPTLVAAREHGRAASPRPIASIAPPT
jgi:hypothetical protein